MTRLALALLFALAALACSPKARGHEDDLLSEVRGYQEGLRWRRLDDAAARLPPADREQFLDRLERLEGELFIDDYEITRVKHQAGGEKATVQVKLTWHLDSVGVVYESVLTSTWTRVGKAWLRTSEVLERGEAVPGVALAHTDQVDPGVSGGPDAGGR